MLSRPVGFVLASALSANAFLIPTGLLPGQPDNAVAFADPLLTNTRQSWFVRLPCADCNVKPASSKTTDSQQESDLSLDFFPTHTGAYDYLLNFTITDDGKKLQLGGKTIYPAESFLSSLFASPPVTVHLIPSSASLDEASVEQIHALPRRVTGSAIKMVDMPNKDEARSRITKMAYQIMNVERTPADLDVVKLVLSQKPNGQISVMSIAKKPRLTMEPARGKFLTHHRPDDREHEKPHCEYLPGRLCRLMASYKSGRPCGGRGRHNSPFSRPHAGRPGHHNNMDEHHGDGEWMGTDGERPSRHHTHHHHPHGMTTHFDDWMAVFRFVVAAIASLMVGMVVGLFVAIVGALIGRGIGYLWFKHYRGGQCGGSMVARESESDHEYDAKAPLLEEVLVVYPDEKKQPLYL